MQMPIKDRNIASDAAIAGAKIADGAVTAAKLASDAVETAKIKDANVTAAKLASNAVETAKIKDANVTTAKLADDAVTAAKLNMFVSTLQTGTGAEQSIAHGLGAVPTHVLIINYEEATTATEGAHTDTNVVVTVTNGKSFKVIAIV
jgi:hypothetical protein